MNKIVRQIDALLCHVDRVLWGGGDLVRVLGRAGWLPCRRNVVVDTNGQQWQVIGDVARVDLTRGIVPTAAVVPAEECIFGEFLLPDMRLKALDGVVRALILQRSPLPLDEVQLGWSVEPTVSQGWRVQWGVCRSESVDRARQQVQLTASHPVFLVNQAQALLISDGAKPRELLRQRVTFGAGGGLLAMLILALLTYASVPLFLKRQAVVDAMRETGRLELEAAPVRGVLDKLRQQEKLLTELREIYRDGGSPVLVVEQLSKVMPDDAWLDRIEMTGGLIKISGMANNANDLINMMSRSSVFSDIRAVSPNVRDASAGKDRFSFELRLRTE